MCQNLQWHIKKDLCMEVKLFVFIESSIIISWTMDVIPFMNLNLWYKFFMSLHDFV